MAQKQKVCDEKRQFKVSILMSKSIDKKTFSDGDLNKRNAIVVGKVMGFNDAVREFAKIQLSYQSAGRVEVSRVFLSLYCNSS